MTKREAAIVSAYTGVLIGKFEDMHEYVETILERPVYTHELGNKEMFDCIHEKAKLDFMNIAVGVNNEQIDSI